MSASDTEDTLSTFFCRALYDYVSTDESALSFRKGAVIEVLTRLETGWWDGLLADERGWFPSNYVVVISDEEADVALAESEMSSAGVTDAEDEISAASAVAPARASTATSAADFWVPQVTAAGQIFYLNTVTGEHARDLPVDDDDTLAGSVDGAHTNGAGFGVPARRTGTPEPWRRRLADDGLTYYYHNTLTGQNSWTPPEVEQQQQQQPTPTPPPAAAPAPEPAPAAPVAVFDAAAAEHAAAVLQAQLAPPSPEALQDLAAHARSAIAAASALIAQGGPALDARLAECVRALRSLLLASAPPYGQIPHTLYPRNVPPAGTSAALAAMHTQLKPAQRRVTATLSKLVLAALAVSYDVASHGAPSDARADAVARMETDAAELENALGTFVLEVQRANTTVAPAERTLGKRRLFGVFLPAGVGSALVGGGGPAGGWRGFGFVGESEGAPDRELGEVLGELRRAARAIEEGVNAVRVDPAANALALLASAQSFADLLASINVAKTVDVDGIGVQAQQQTNGEGAAYRASVLKARSLMRTLEAAAQALHDDAAQLLFLSQTLLSLPAPPANPFSAPSARTEAELLSAQRAQHGLAESAALVRAHALRVVDTADALATLGREQRERGGGRAWRASVEWRTSRLLALPADGLPYDGDAFGAALGGAYGGERHAPYANGHTNGYVPGLGEEGDEDTADDVVGWDFAVSKPAARVARAAQLAASSSGSSSSGAGYPVPPASATPYTAPHAQHPGPHSAPGQYSASFTSSETPTIVEELAGPSRANGNGHRPADSLDSFGSDLELDGGSVLGDGDGLAAPNGANGGGKSPARSKAADKLLRVLGDAPAHIIDKLNEKSKPWYLKSDYEEGKDIAIDPDGKIRGGTVAALVERLTAHENTDMNFIKTFLMTFKSFTDVDELVKLLIERFWIPLPDGLTKDEADEWRRLKQHIIRTRVLNILRSMILDDDVLEEKDMGVLDRMAEFVRHEEVQAMAVGKQLGVQIDRTRKGDSARARTTISYDAQPTPIVPRGMKRAKLVEFDPLEVARQLTIIECGLFMKIKAGECLTRSREQKPEKDNISAAIETSNKIAHWVADAVLDKEDTRKRAGVVKHFILIADRCRELRNFSSMIAIVSGLNSPPVRRLKRTWDQISKAHNGMMTACEMTIDSGKNFNNYRQLLARITPPCVPFIGVYLTTLTFIQDGAPNTINGNMVNFRKRAKAAEVIQEIQKWQSKPFNFARVEPIADYLAEQLGKFNETPDAVVSDMFWQLSLEREPREREDEKMARLLQETGFL